MKNVVLIGMPGAGKSTIGVLLAKSLLMDFVDTDLIIYSRPSSADFNVMSFPPCKQWLTYITIIYLFLFNCKEFNNKKSPIKRDFILII